jgi:thioesterase domain-containing protein
MTLGKTASLVFAVPFMMLWTFGMVTVLASKPCRDGLWAGETPTACTIHRAGLEAHRKIGQPVRPADAIFLVVDGIALAESDPDAAYTLFAEALALSNTDTQTIRVKDTDVPIMVVRLVRMMPERDMSEDTLALWREALQDFLPIGSKDGEVAG